MRWTKSNNYIRKRFGKVLHIFEPVYRENIYYIYAKDEAEFVKIFNTRYKDNLVAKGRNGSFSLVTIKGTDVGVIWADDVVNLAHECLHATFWIARDRGLDLCFESEEAFCYLQAFLLRAITNQ